MFTKLSMIKCRVDIVVYENYGNDYWAQERYLVHGLHDIFWTSDLEEALNFLRYDLGEDEND